MRKSKRNKKPGYFVGLTREQIVDMVEALGVVEGGRLSELDESYAGGDLQPNLIWVMIGSGGIIGGVTVVWDTEAVTFARRDGKLFVGFAWDHLDNIAELQGGAVGYDNPMTLYRIKAAEAGVNCVVVNYLQIDYNS